MFQPDLFAMQAGAERLGSAPLSSPGTASPSDILAAITKRPRYGYLVLELIARVGGRHGSAGPLVRVGEEAVPVREWLSEALMPAEERDARYAAMRGKVRAELERMGNLPADEPSAATLIEEEARKRVRAGGVCNVSRVVSDLVAAGLLRRHYQGYRVDHENRGAQRQAVYTLTGKARRLLLASEMPERSSWADQCAT